MASSLMTSSVVAEQVATRMMVVWCPDWPVVAAMADEDLPAHLPVAVVEHHQVFACSPAARAEGVRRRMRRREAAAHCPELIIMDHLPERDVRAFEVVLAAIEELSPPVAPIRPGLCAVQVPQRYYGGEVQAAAVIAEHLVGVGVWDCRMGIADGLFAAEQAARQAAPQDSMIIPPRGSARFVADLPISVFDDAELTSLLRRLGIRSVGDFARLPPRDVLTRFGREGAWLHRLARGLDGRAMAGRQPPPELDQRISFAPALETIEPIAFSMRQGAERFVAGLAHHDLVCSTVKIEVTTENGWVGSRRWSHSRWFSAADLVDRTRWQLQADPAPDPVNAVHLTPEAVDSLADHEEGLWEGASDDRVDKGVAKIQSLLGPDAVLAPQVQGGRSAHDRQLLTPWGERPIPARNGALPWPGSIPPPAPARVFPQPYEARVVSTEGHPVGLTDRGMLTAEPAAFAVRTKDRMQPIDAWAGPWPIDELWWDPMVARHVARFQIVGTDGSAWLLVYEGGHWWTEARYD